MINQFAYLSAESAESRFAQFTPEEHAEYQAWLDAVEVRNGEAAAALLVAPVEPEDYHVRWEDCLRPWQWFFVRLFRRLVA